MTDAELKAARLDADRLIDAAAAGIEANLKSLVTACQARDAVEVKAGGVGKNSDFWAFRMVASNYADVLAFFCETIQRRAAEDHYERT